MNPSRAGAIALVALLLGAGLPSTPVYWEVVAHRPAPGPSPGDAAVANFTAALQRLVDLVGAGGGAILALVWARVALSWFSHDVTKKVQAKERARDALVGSLIFVAALSGLVWALAQWVLTGG